MSRARCRLPRSPLSSSFPSLSGLEASDDPVEGRARPHCLRRPLVVGHVVAADIFSAALDHIELGQNGLFIGFELRSDLALAGTLRIGGLTMARVPIGYAQSPVFAQLGLDDRPALILGMQNLRVFDRVAIDFADRRILFDLPDGSQSGAIRKQIFFPSRIGT